MRKLGSVDDQAASIQQESQQHETSAALQGNALVPVAKVSVNPLDPVQLENWVLDSTGFLNLRPPLTPAESGSENVYVIPFQVMRAQSKPVVLDALYANHVHGLSCGRSQHTPNHVRLLVRSEQVMHMF